MELASLALLKMRLYDDFQPLYQLYSCTCRFPPVAPKRFIRWCPFLVLTHVLGQKRIRPCQAWCRIEECLKEEIFCFVIVVVDDPSKKDLFNLNHQSTKLQTPRTSALLLVTVDGSHQISRVASEGDTNLASDSDYSTTSFELQFAMVKNGFMHSDQ